VQFPSRFIVGEDVDRRVSVAVSRPCICNIAAGGGGVDLCDDAVGARMDGLLRLGAEAQVCITDPDKI
jgi:hypothetical protein